MDLFFCSLSSGSSGNCYFLGTSEGGVLVDAGISAKATRNFLKDLEIPTGKISGILVTHGHHDHTKGLQVLTKRHHIPVFTSEKVWKSILKSPMQQEISIDCFRYIIPFEPFTLNGLTIEAFTISHDTPETLGYYIRCGSRNITIVTDLGYICDTAASYIKKADFLVIESNYDENMLLNGKYPSYLKKRVNGKKGHLCNNITARFLADNMNPRLSHVCLAHLSKNNNTPELALQAIHEAFQQKGINLNGEPNVVVLQRHCLSEKISINSF